MERTLVLIKPDGYRKGVTGSDVIEGTTLKIINTRVIYTPDIEKSRRHYAEHESKPYFERISNTASAVLR